MAKRILAVDDNEDILDILDLMLTIDGYQVETSLSPASIEKQIIDFKPDLILLDIQMGTYNGLDICKKLKSNLYSSEIPVVIISSDDSIYQAEQYGADGFIAKPFEMNTLLSKAATFTEGRNTGYSRASA
ncbi:response regulator [Desertivirga arenae]|uniref:response regulator n=1 Tax=Desertivirga arenae TaxID=2810309 RepID=UPI001A97670C|nr:response regulator [Pedobacter sp. SYSU D00823]